MTCSYCKDRPGGCVFCDQQRERRAEEAHQHAVINAKNRLHIPDEHLAYLREVQRVANLNNIKNRLDHAVSELHFLGVDVPPSDPIDGQNALR